MQKKQMVMVAAQGVLGALGLALLAMGQQRMLGGKPMAGAWLGAIGVGLGLLAWILPTLWDGLAGFIAQRRAAAAAALKARGRAKPGPAGAKGRNGEPAGAPRRSLATLLEFIPAGHLDLPRWLYLLAAAGLLIVTQIFWLRGKVALGFITLLFAFLPSAVFLQDRERPIRIPNLRYNFVTLLLLLPGLPFQLLGTVELWQYQNVFTGYALEALGGALWLAALWKHPFKLELEGEAEQPSVYTPAPEPFFTRNRIILKAGLVLAAIVLALSARPLLLSDKQGLALMARVAAIACLLASFPWLPRSLGNLPAMPESLRPWIGLAGLLAAFYLAMAGQARLEAGQFAAGLSWFLAGAILMVLSISPADPARRPLGPGWMQGRGAKLLEVAAVFGLLGMAFYFRFHRIDLFPYMAEGDEAAGGLLAWDILYKRIENQLVHQNIPLFPFQVTSFFFWLKGLSMGTMRWHSVVFGTISVASTYFFLRLFGGRLVAFACTLLMSLAYWHLHYSRFGHYNIEQVAYQMVAFYFVFKGLRSQRIFDFIIGGVAFGFAMLPHLSSRLLPFGAIALLLYWFAARRQVLRRHFTGLLAFILGAWILAAPALAYWARVIPLSMGRAQSVSIFDRSNTNAPRDLYAGLVANIKSSAMMFNFSSDTRPRNNPIAPEKILEHWTATAFMLSLLYVLYHWRQPLNFFIVTLFTIILSASVFSVEAPQTLRTAGNISLVFTIIAIPLMDLRRQMAKLPKGLGPLILGLILLPAFSWFGYKSWHKYFVERSAQAFDVLPSLIALRTGEALGTNTQSVFYATGFGSGHPPVILFRKEVPIRNYYDIIESVPIYEQWGMNHLMFFADDYKPAAAYFKYVYPGATEEVFKDPRDGQEHYILYSLSHEERRKRHGLEAEAEIGGRIVKLANQPLAWPLKGLEGATRVRFKGLVIVPRTAEWVPGLNGAGRASFRLDGRPWSAGRGVVAMGLHTLEVDFSPQGPKPMQGLMNAGAYNNGIAFNKRGPGPQELNEAVLVSGIKPQGWYVNYYANIDWDGKPICEMIQPMILANWLDSPMPGQWSAKAKAQLRIDTAGVYSFNIPTPAYGEVWVDGRFVARGGAAPMVLERPQPLGSIQLAKGWHSIEYRFSTGGNPWMHLRWSGPDGNGPILPERLQPALP